MAPERPTRTLWPITRYYKCWYRERTSSFVVAGYRKSFPRIHLARALCRAYRKYSARTHSDLPVPFWGSTIIRTAITWRSFCAICKRIGCPRVEVRPLWESARMQPLAAFDRSFVYCSFPPLFKFIYSQHRLDPATTRGTAAKFSIISVKIRSRVRYGTCRYLFYRYYDTMILRYTMPLT